MTIQLGRNAWILIGLSFLEILFIIIPALIAGKVEKKGFFKELNDIGFRKNRDTFLVNLLKISAGIGLGILLFMSGSIILYFFRNIIIKFIFGPSFVQKADAGTISSQAIQPSIAQLIIIIILQLFIIGICEEAFFRAFLISKLKQKMKLRYAIILSLIFFSLYHVPPFLVPITTIITFFGYYFLIGLLLSLFFLYFDYSLIPISIAHSIFNILIILL